MTRRRGAGERLRRDIWRTGAVVAQPRRRPRGGGTAQRPASQVLIRLGLAANPQPCSEPAL